MKGHNPTASCFLLHQFLPNFPIRNNWFGWNSLTSWPFFAIHIYWMHQLMVDFILFCLSFFLFHILMGLLLLMQNQWHKDMLFLKCCGGDIVCVDWESKSYPTKSGYPMCFFLGLHDHNLFFQKKKKTDLFNLVVMVFATIWIWSCWFWRFVWGGYTNKVWVLSWRVSTRKEWKRI